MLCVVAGEGVEAPMIEQPRPISFTFCECACVCMGICEWVFVSFFALFGFVCS